MHRLDRRQVLADDVLEVTAALVHIAQHAAQDALIGIGLDEDLEVEEIAQALILEDQDALDDDDLARLDDLRLLRARVAREVVDGTLDALSLAQRLEMRDEQVRLERVRMVVVDVLALLKRNLVMCPVVIIVIDDRDAVPEMRLEPVRECGLARARAARNADNRRLQF